MSSGRARGAMEHVDEREDGPELLGESQSAPPKARHGALRQSTGADGTQHIGLTCRRSVKVRGRHAFRVYTLLHCTA